MWSVPASGRRPINSPAGPSSAAGVPWVGLAILLVLALILAAFVAYFFFDVGREADSTEVNSPGVPALLSNDERTGNDGQVGGHSDGSLGFPAVATRNTSRISGSDPSAISIAAALASYPTVGPGTPPAAATIASDDQWQAGILAATLAAAPINAPLILAPDGTLSEDGETVISEFDPEGSPLTGEKEVFAIGKVAPPSGYETSKVNAKDPASLAVKVAELKADLTDAPPAAFVVVSSEDAEFATPAAAWAARSGDVVLFSDRDSVPAATLDFLKKKENADVPVFVLGPTGAVSAEALEQLGKVSKTVERVGGADPVAAALELVRFSSGTFGWNLNDPGHGFVVARSDRPMDAIAVASLSTGGTWPALLLTDSADKLPQDVSDYLLDNQPGYVDDPTRAVFDRIWIIGDESLISVNQQAVIDASVELTEVGS